MKHRYGRRAVAIACAAAGGAALTLVAAAPAGAATTALFVHGQGVLTIAGDSGDNTIVVSRDAAGNILVNQGAVDIHGTTATVDNVRLLQVFAGAGNDSVSLDETNGPLPQADIFGGAGNDRLAGSSAADRIFGEDGDDAIEGGRGAEFLSGGAGNDFVDGNQGADVADLGDGNDVFQWDPGDGSDVVEGGSGVDSMVFNGSAGAERFDVSAQGDRVLFTRDLGTITMNLHGIEEIDTRALGGADSFTAHDLTGTDITALDVDEAGATGTPDAATDRVTVFGTAGPDVIRISGSATAGVSITGLSETVRVTGTDSFDGVDVEAAAGDDVVDAHGLSAGVVTFSADGGAGADLLVGSVGDDQLHGGDGDDLLEGGPGTDTLDGGTGDNVLIQ
jgi:Ca2+-binding RTX toxin-like protein